MGDDQFVVILTKSGQISSKDRSIIYSHSARRGHEKRRRQRSHHNNSGHGQPISLRRGLSDSSSDSSKDDAHSPDYFCYTHDDVASNDLSQVNPSLTLQICGNGMSDPFNTQPVQIDATGTFYLNIGFNYLETVVWNSGLRVWCTPRGFVAPRTTIAEIGPSLHRYGSQFAHLPSDIRVAWASTYENATLGFNAGALFAATGRPEHATQAIRYTTKCIAGLRFCITTGEGLASLRPEQLMFRLIRAEVMVQNLSSATIHARYLKKLFLIRAAKGELDLALLLHAMYATNNLAFAQWERPIFDASWLEDIYRFDWALAMVPDESLSTFEADLQAFTTNNSLRKMLANTKLLFLHTSSCSTGKSVLLQDKWYSMSAHAEWLQICLFNFVLDHYAEPSCIHNLTAAIAMDIDLCIALVTVLSIRFQKHEPLLNNLAVSPVSRIILTKLRAFFDRMESQITRVELLQYNDVLLWIALVAAIIESRLQKSLAKHGRPHARWWQKLVQIVVGRRICSWKELRACLAPFPFSEDETPLPTSDWLDKAFELAKNLQVLLGPSTTFNQMFDSGLLFRSQSC